MPTNINAWLVATKPDLRVRPHLVCRDGTVVSVQASWAHSCIPRGNEGPYTHVEVWCFDAPTPSTWSQYGEPDVPSCSVPVELVEEYIDAHGGIAAIEGD